MATSSSEDEVSEGEDFEDLIDRQNELYRQLILDGFDPAEAQIIVDDELPSPSSPIDYASSADDDSDIGDFEDVEVALDENDGDEWQVNQLGGLHRMAPVDVHLSDRIDLTDQWHRMSERFGVEVLELRFQPAEELQLVAGDEDLDVRPIHFIDQFLEAVVTYLRENLNLTDYVQLELISDNLPNGGVINPLVPVGELDHEPFLTQVENVIQSNTAVAVDDGSMTLNVTHFSVPRGSGYGDKNRHDIHLKTFAEFNLESLKNKKCIHSVPERYDPFCGVVSLMFAQSLHDVCEPHERRHIFRRYKNFTPLVMREANRLCRVAGISFCGGVSVESLGVLMELFPYSNHPLVVFSAKSYMTPIYKCNLNADGKPIYLLLDKRGDYGIITSVNSFLGKPGVFCVKCEKFFTGQSTKHTCDRRLCKQCKTRCPNNRDQLSDQSDDYIVCDSCRRGFKGRVCYDSHLVQGKSPLLPGTRTVCESFVACRKCYRDLQAKNGVPTGRNAYDKTDHKCFTHKCRTCGQIVDSQHQCFIRKLNPTLGKSKERYVDARGTFYFFDMETCTETTDAGKRFFEVNVVCAMDETGDISRRFKGSRSLHLFMSWIFLDDNALYGSDMRYTFVSHNGSRFDMMFVMQWFCVNMTTCQPNVIFNHRSPMEIKLGNIYFIDSCLFIKSPLSALPKQFGLQDVSKGDFPHEFNLKANYSYEGNLPAPSYFGIRFMSPSRYEKFMEWWNEEDDAIRQGTKPLWNFQHQIVEYCMRDVDVLRRSWLAFQQSMFEITGLIPGILNMSAASFTNLVWKTTLESSFEIGIVPRNNYFYQDNQSAVAFEWLSWLDAFYYSYEMIYAGKCQQGEKRVVVGKKFKVDGYHPPTKRVFEFAGCFYHGCDRCTLPDKRSVYSNLTNRDLKTQFDNRVSRLVNAGLQVEVMWECEWKKLKSADVEVQEQLLEIADETYKRDPLNPRDALYGGRTEVFAMFFDSLLNEDPLLAGMAGVDINSMYPSIMANGKMPFGHPKSLVGPPSRFDHTPYKYFGAIRAKVYPPRGLFFPVLPCRIPTGNGNHKLMFTLCFTCAKNKQQETCCHSDEERALYDTWCSDELYQAVEDGYVIAFISAVWDYENRFRFGLFREFVKKFYQIKVQASGYPKNCDTDEKKATFIREFEEKEGIKLDPSKMVYNAGNRACAKLLLNSSWGKFAQNPKRVSTKMTHSGANAIKFITDSSIANKSIKFINCDTVLLRGEVDLLSKHPDTKGNVIHAAIITALLRLLLLKYLKKVGPRAFYCDTDSAFYLESEAVLSGREESAIPRSDFLGGMSDEFSRVCKHFYALGPKNYCYEKPDGTRVVKVRGFTETRESCKRVNVDVMRQLLLEAKERGSFEDSRAISVPFFIMVRGDKCNPFTMSPEVRQKLYRVVSDKRVVQWTHPHLQTLPYGY